MHKYLKYSLPLFVSLLLGWFLLRHGIRWIDLLSVLKQSRWSILLLALICQAFSFGAVTYLNQILLQAYGATVPYGKQFMVQLAMAFVEAVVPSASISGVVLRARLLKAHNVSPDVAAITTMSEGTLIFASVLLPTFLVVGMVGINSARIFNGLSRWLILLIVPVILIIIITWNSVYFARLRTERLQMIGRFWDRYIQPRWLNQSEGWHFQHIIQRLHQLWAQTLFSVQYRLYSILTCLVARFGFEALCLMMCFYALGRKLPLITLLLVYPLTIAINTLGAIPGGVGLAEVSIATLYSQLGISTEMAITIAVAYRIIGYWLPRVIGGLAWSWIERSGLQESTSESIP